MAVSHSIFSNWGYYGIQVREGTPEINGNYFTGDGGRGIFYDGGFRQVVVGGHVRNNHFADLTRSNAIAIDLYGVRDDGLDWSSEPLLQDNTLTYAPWGSPNQIGVYINNSLDTLRCLRNAIRGSSGWPGYGVLDYSTSMIWMGDTTAAESLSAVWGARNGFYPYPSWSGDADYATVRQTSIKSWSSSDAFGVKLINYARIDLGTAADPGYNALYGDLDCCGPSAPPVQYTVYNGSADTVYAIGNYWDGKYCSKGVTDPCWPFVYSDSLSGPVIYTGELSINPFEIGGIPPPKLAVTPSDTGKGLTFGGLTNYPNPFNASTVVQFSIAKTGHVDAVVYNILGQKVKTLWNGPMEAGVNTISWDGRDASGRPLASGVYLYRVVSEDGQLTKSMVVLK